MAQLAEACVRYVQDALGLVLDYSPDTLPILDHYTARARGEKPEVIDLLGPALGAYFGEVVRRQVAGARWYAPADNYLAYRLQWEPFFLCFNPIGVAVETLTMQDATGFGGHFQVLDEARPAIARALEGNAEVRTEDYYTFSVRLEALEQIADILAGIESQQQKPRLFGSDVYRAASGDSSKKEAAN